jgi:hypothetical protein
MKLWVVGGEGGIVYIPETEGRNIYKLEVCFYACKAYVA